MQVMTDATVTEPLLAALSLHDETLSHCARIFGFVSLDSSGAYLPYRVI